MPSHHVPPVSPPPPDRSFLNRFLRGCLIFTVITLAGVFAVTVPPVLRGSRLLSRQAQCRANLHQIAVALHEYRADTGAYPVAPYHDAGAGRYFGGVSALFPQYISDMNVLLCPDDLGILRRRQAAVARVYSSYNGHIESGSWEFGKVIGTNPDGGSAVAGRKRTYNYNGYCQEGWDVFAYHPTVRPPYARVMPAWLRDKGLSYRHYPRLSNRNAPDDAYVTHCVHHRRFYPRPNAQMDVTVTIGGSTTLVNVSQMSQPGPDAAHPSKWVLQDR